MQNDQISVKKCFECFTGKHRCFLCKENTGDIVKCSEKKCGKFYHLKCLLDQNYPHKILNEEQKKFKCPLHFCLTCYNEHLEDCVIRTVKKPLLTCIKCPTAYHYLNECIAAGSYFVDSDHIVCPEHVEKTEIKKNGKTTSQHVNVNWCFYCNAGGELICCEKCPAARHLNCIIKDEGSAPDDDGYYCSDCKARNQFHYGDIVWVKMASFRWWPAQIRATHHVPDNILSLKHSDGDFPVYFFGTNTYNWVNRSKAFLYVEGDDKKRISSTGRNLDRRFKKAMEEVAEAYKKWQKDKESTLQSKTSHPVPYFHLKVNKPYGNCQQAFVDLDKSNKQTCECDENASCSNDVECLNRLMYYECDIANCRNREKCQNQRFKKRQYAKTEKFKSNSGGWGLRSLEDIKKGQFVIEYVGELIDEAECDKRLSEMAARNDRNFYFLTIDKDCIIDAGPKGNLARFMNHSCDPNCETQKWVVNNQIRVGLFAKCDIPAQTELTFNYNLECRGDDKTKCLCKSKNCSGYIGVRPNKIVEEKQKSTAKKRKIKPDFASLHEDECFRCGEVGKLIMCDSKDCPKSYHLECLNLEKPPFGKWICPVHHCDICGKKAVKFCNHCPSSYCSDHESNGMETLPNGDLICKEHTATYVNKVRRCSKSTTIAPIETPKSTNKSINTSSKSVKKESLDQSSSFSLPAAKKTKITNIERREERDEFWKKEIERKRLSHESRELRMKKRSSIVDDLLDSSNRKRIRKENDNADSEMNKSEIINKEDKIDKDKIFDKKDVDKKQNEISKENTNLCNDLKTNDEKESDVDYEIDFSSNTSNSLDATSLKNIATNITNNGLETDDKLNNKEMIEDKIEQNKEEERKIDESIKEDDIKNDSENNQNNQSSSSEETLIKGISQKENIDLEEQTVGKILSDEILFNDESNESYFSSQNFSTQQSAASTQSNGTSQQNGKKLDDPQQINSVSTVHLSNDENMNHNLKLMNGNANLSNEINEPAS